MSTTVQPRAGASSSALSEPADRGLAVVGLLALGVGVVDDQPEARASPAVVHSQHLQVAVGVAERGDRAPADELLDADRLARLVVDEVELRQAHEHRLAVAQLELELARAADDLLGRDAVDASVQGRMNSTPPPETMKVLKPFARR